MMDGGSHFHLNTVLVVLDVIDISSVSQLTQLMSFGHWSFHIALGTYNVVTCVHQLVTRRRLPVVTARGRLLLVRN